MKRRYQISLIFELEDEKESRMDDLARRLEMNAYYSIKDEVKDTFEDMVWIVDENCKCIGSL